MTEHEDDAGSFPDELLEALEPHLPPAGFADRVMIARERQQLEAAAGPTRWPWVAGAAALAASLCAAAVFLVVTPRAALGEVSPDARTSVEIGARGTAVVEAGAEVAWRQSFGGAVVVDQPRGSVFYRVERGEAFEVRTPSGSVHVTGTSFNVEVPMKGMKMNAVSGIAGAVLATAAWVTVYEGSVDVESKGETVSIAAGERAELRGDAAPRVVAGESRAELLASRAELRAQVQTLEGQLKEIMIEKANGGDPVAKRSQQLEAELRQLRGELEVEQALRLESEGEKVAFPEGLGEAYRESGLMKSFQAAFAATGIEGEVKAIDCNEYPCIVFGEFSVTGASSDETGKVAEQFWDALNGQYPEAENNRGISHSKFKDTSDDGTVNVRSLFGVTVTPKDLDDANAEQRKKVNRRVRWRNQQYMDSVSTR